MAIIAARLRFNAVTSVNLAGKYTALKRELAERFGNGRDGYPEAKTRFIRFVEDGSTLLTTAHTSVN